MTYHLAPRQSTQAEKAYPSLSVSTERKRRMLPAPDFGAEAAQAGSDYEKKRQLSGALFARNALRHSDAEQAFVSAQENLPLADRRRGKGLFTQFISRHALELRPGADHVHYPVVIQKINQPRAEYE